MSQERRDRRLSVGASGAEIEFTDEGTVIKRDNEHADRLMDQCRMMQEIGPPVFPRIIGASPALVLPYFSYEMEELDPLEWTGKRAEGGIIWEMIQVLTLVWGQYTQMKLGDVLKIEHAEYMLPRWGPYHRHMERWLGTLIDLHVTCVNRIHGDPTVENVMQRDGRVVLIDPLPANVYIPAIISVDLGKMLQSIFGYEALLRPGEPGLDPKDRMALGDALTGVFTKGDELVARYFLCVHIARLIPYQPVHKRYIFWDMLTHVIEVYAP